MSEADGLRAEIGGETLSVARGEALSLLGLSAGASRDALRRIAGFGAAEVSLDGQEIGHLPPERRPLAYVGPPEEPLFPHLDVVGNVGFGPRAGGLSAAARAAAVARAIAICGLERWTGTAVAHLPAPARLRVRLARQIARGGDVLLLDHPLDGLEPEEVSGALGLLSRLRTALGLTLVCACSRREEAMALGSRIALVEKGALLQCGTTQDLLDRPATERIAVAFGDANALVGHVTAIEDDVAVVRLASGAVMEGMAAHGLQADALGVLCVRPERVAIMQTGAAEVEGTLPATLLEARHLGDHVLLRLRDADGVELSVRRPAAQLMRGLDPGRDLSLAWGPAQAMVFPVRGDLY